MEQLIHMTATYSNAVLLVVLTNVSDFAKKLELPIPQPITISQVQTFKPHPFKNYFGGVLTLTNGAWFAQDGNGCINGYHAPDDYYTSNGEDWGKFDISKYFGHINMITNELIEFARNQLRKLGYDPKNMHADGPPTHFDGGQILWSNTIPYYDIEWKGPRMEHPADQDMIRIGVNAEKKHLVHFLLISTNAWRPDPKLDVVPELESDYRKPIAEKMFIRSNAPARLPQSRPSGLNPPTNSPARSTNSIQ
jgi:hypothetical protein